MNNRKTRRKGWIAIVMLVIMLVQMVGVNAAEDVKETIDGVVTFDRGDASLEIVSNSGQSLVGKDLQLHRLFDAENSTDMKSIDYTLNPTYQAVLQKVVAASLNKDVESVTEYVIIDYMESMNSNPVSDVDAAIEPEGRYSDYRYFIEQVATEISEAGIVGEQIHIASVNAQGNVKIMGLSYGYYMVQDVSDAERKHTALSMPLLSTANPDTTIRIKSDYPNVIQKIKEDDGDLWNDIGDYEIGQEIEFRYQSDVPNMDGYEQYFYAWHANHDEALTFKRGSVKIQIDDYELKSTEILVSVLEHHSMFVITVDNIKAIIDREFPDKKYDQQVTVTFLAYLNDKAALDSGRPGFENDVRLQFSNDPTPGNDKASGFTGWDTVVCFNYQLQGKKINNYGTNLEGAKFRLYSDAACENEILVQKVAERYHIMHEDTLDESKRALATEIVSDENGDFNIVGLDADTYYLKEVQAPDGYRPLLDPIQIQVDAQFPTERDSYVKGDGANADMLNLSAKAYVKSFVNGSEVEKEIDLETEPEEGSLALAVVNEVGSLLPASGSYAILIIGAACIGLFVVSVLRAKKKHE